MRTEFALRADTGAAGAVRFALRAETEERYRRGPHTVESRRARTGSSRPAEIILTRRLRLD